MLRISFSWPIAGAAQCGRPSGCRRKAKAGAKGMALAPDCRASGRDGQKNQASRWAGRGGGWPRRHPAAGQGERSQCSRSPWGAQVAGRGRAPPDLGRPAGACRHRRAHGIGSGGMRLPMRRNITQTSACRKTRPRSGFQSGPKVASQPPARSMKAAAHQAVVRMSALDGKRKAEISWTAAVPRAQIETTLFRCDFSRRHGVMGISLVETSEWALKC